MQSKNASKFIDNAIVFVSYNGNILSNEKITIETILKKDAIKAVELSEEEIIEKAIKAFEKSILESTTVCNSNLKKRFLLKFDINGDN